MGDVAQLWCQSGACVCLWAGQRTWQNKKEKLSSEASWVLSSCGNDEKRREPLKTKKSEREELTTHAHTLPNLIFQTFHSHCAGFFVPSQTAFCCDDGRSCCHTINYSFLMETNRFFVPIVFGGINRSLEAFILLPLHWTGWQNTGSRL